MRKDSTEAKNKLVSNKHVMGIRAPRYHLISSSSLKTTCVLHISWVPGGACQPGGNCRSCSIISWCEQFQMGLLGPMLLYKFGNGW